MRYKIIFYLIFLMAPGAQNVLSQSNHFIFHELNQSNGLSELQNPYIFKDSQGFVWIGSYDGLNRFDGKTIKVFRPVLPNGKTDPHISSRVFEDALGDLWFTTYNGLFRLSSKTEALDPLVLQTIHKSTIEDYYAFHLDKHNRLWVIADDSLRLVDLSTGKDSVLHPLHTYICQAIEDAKGEVVGLAIPKPDSPGGIDIIQYGQEEQIVKTSYFTGDDVFGLPLAKIIFLRTEGDSILWLPSDIGLIRFPWRQPKQYKVFSLKKNKKDTFFWDVALCGNQILATSFGGGLTIFDRNGKVIDNKTSAWNGVQNIDFTKLNNLLVTDKGDIWISSWGKGIYYSNLKRAKFFQLLGSSQSQTTQAHSVLDLAVDAQDRIYCILPEEGLYIFDKSLNLLSHHEKIFLKNGSLARGKMNRIYLDKEGGIWLQAGIDLYYSVSGTGHFQWVGKNLDGQSEIIQISPTRFIIMSLTRLYEISKPEHSILDFEKIKPLEVLGRTYKCFWDENKTLLVSDGFDKLSVYEIQVEGIKLRQEHDGVGYVNGAVFSKGSRVFWLASNKGLIKLDESGIVNFIKDRQNLLSRSFNAILQDHHQNLWLSSNAGLFKYDPSTGEVKHYTESDGLQGMQFMLGSACKLSDGRLAFGGVNGLNIFHPDSVHDNPNPPIIHFTDWIVNDTGSISTSPEYLLKQSFSFNNRTLSFHFVGIDYTAPEEVKYKYRLAGYEKDTVEGGTNGFARYAQLPAGDYTFQVWAANSDGVWTVSPHELHFTIEPPWHATWWARSGELLLALGLLYAFYQNRIARIRRKETERRKEAEFRQKEAESKQLAAELQNSVLRLQMNPHFIFNSMNSISSYILQKDIDTANQYLSRFAKLMRLILDLASKPLIPIADEIELLEQYMAAESMRFENKFTWQVELDEALDPEEIVIPTMILQPFVENAIWHGFSRKTSVGHIHIGFQKQEGSMICTVKDNGIGRMESSKNEPALHQSKAVQITEQRLLLIERKEGPKTDLAIIDLYENTGLPLGTKVVIKLPLDL